MYFIKRRTSHSNCVNLITIVIFVFEVIIYSSKIETTNKSTILFDMNDIKNNIDDIRFSTFNDTLRNHSEFGKLKQIAKILLQ